MESFLQVVKANEFCLICRKTVLNDIFMSVCDVFAFTWQLFGETPNIFYSGGKDGGNTCGGT